MAGVWAVSAAVVLYVFQDLWEIFHFDWYRVMLADFPDWLVCIRYIVSIALRIITLWAVAGVLTRREVYRKILVGLSYFNGLMVFIHHPYRSFVYISNYLGLNSDDFKLTAFWFGHHYYPGAVVRMLNVWVEEIFLAIVVILFFSHPRVKRLFQ